jgi:hypothetical protein
MNRNFRTLLLSTTLLVSSVAALAADKAAALKPFNADYVASYMGMQANATMTLASAGANRWTYSLNLDNGLARLSQSTTFEERDGQWRPLSGNDVSQVFIKHANKQATYDWARGEARWSGDVKPDRVGPVKLQAGDLDAMLVNLAIARDGAAGKALSYRMVDEGRAKQLSYEAAGKEAITVDGKSRQANRYTRTDGEKQTIVWVVDGLPVPARILQRKNGKDEMDLRFKAMR